MHFHSFFSYNAKNWSPSHIAWASRKAGLYAAGLCDFDVLDGLAEFLAAGRTLGLRVTVNVETRAFVNDYDDKEISSPGEPGVAYVMGAGYAREIPDGTPQAADLAGYRQRARSRNTDLIDRINPHLGQVVVDYETDVLPLTPTGAATERHIIRAYTSQARKVLGDGSELVRFWAELLGIPCSEVEELLDNIAGLEEVVRARLVKRGGLGYEEPSSDTFPRVEDFMGWVASCGAVPMATWLDGTSAGEKDGRALLECMRSNGAAALNIIPDRNWNMADPDAKAVKIRNLAEIVGHAEDMGLPINIGTEMNKDGLPFVDDLDCEALLPHKAPFLRGARIMTGHTILARYAGLSYVGDRADAEFRSVQEKNRCFERVGALPPLDQAGANDLEELGEDKAFDFLMDKASV